MSEGTGTRQRSGVVQDSPQVQTRRSRLPTDQVLLLALRPRRTRGVQQTGSLRLSKRGGSWHQRHFPVLIHQVDVVLCNVYMSRATTWLIARLQAPASPSAKYTAGIWSAISLFSRSGSPQASPATSRPPRRNDCETHPRAAILCIPVDHIPGAVAQHIRATSRSIHLLTPSGNPKRSAKAFDDLHSEVTAGSCWVSVIHI